MVSNHHKTHQTLCNNLFFEKKKQFQVFYLKNSPIIAFSIFIFCYIYDFCIVLMIKKSYF